MLQQSQFTPKVIHRLKVKGWKKIFHATNREKKSRNCSTYITQNRLQNKVTRDKGHYIMRKGSVQQENITITNIYAPNTGSPT